MSETLFVSDLHLEAKRRPITDRFLRLLEQRASKADALYILGDLFEVWIGDDGADAHDREIRDRLKRLADLGVPIYLLLGNRDFLLGNEYLFDAGMKPIPDPTTIDLYGTRTLLMHGDSLCTDDAAYMAFRHIARGTAWRDEFLSKPLEERRRIAHGLRKSSEKQKREKPVEIMDVNPMAARTTFTTAQVRRIIHGHTHR